MGFDCTKHKMGGTYQNQCPLCVQQYAQQHSPFRGQQPMQDMSIPSYITEIIDCLQRIEALLLAKPIESNPPDET